MIHPTLQSRGNADTAVVLLTGTDRLSLDSVAFSLADSYASVCAISYDVRPNGEADAGLSIVRRVSRPVGQGVGVGDVEIFDLSDCCLSCSVKHDAGGTLASLRGQARVFLVSLPVGLEATPVAQYLEDMMRLDSWGDGMGVAAVVNAVGLDEFEERFFDDDRLCVYGTGDEGGVFDERSTGAVVSRLIREATHVLELPVVGRGCLSRMWMPTANARAATSSAPWPGGTPWWSRMPMRRTCATSPACMKSSRPSVRDRPRDTPI